ncbi:MAG: LacI family DNA-binding transcriptional regulator [Rhizobiaceae bacterium]
MNKQLPTIQDVARAANVSTATVSRALSYPERVSEETRKQVTEAIEQTGYRLNHTARNLRRQQTGAIVALLPNIGNPFFSRILAGIESAAARAGYSVLISDTRAPHAHDSLLTDYLDHSRADGLIILDASLPSALLRDTSRRRPPIVYCCEWVDDFASPSVRFDNEGGAALAVRHLAELGHRRIGHISGPAGNVLTVARLAGVRRALAELGLPERSEWFFDGDFELASGVAAARAWLAMRERPTGMTAASDVMACGFIAELHRAGVSTPADISVVGFDDIDIAAQFIPGLTTIRQPRLEIGERAAEMLLGLIRAPGEAMDPTPRMLKAELTLRASTAAPSS